MNGVVECYNRTVVERTRAMVLDSGAAKVLWSEAIKYSNYILNRCVTSDTNNHETPAELIYGYKPNRNKIYLFSCLAYKHIQKNSRNKFNSKCESWIFVGMYNGSIRTRKTGNNRIKYIRNTKLDKTKVYQDAFQNKYVKYEISKSEDMNVSKETCESEKKDEVSNDETVYVYIVV